MRPAYSIALLALLPTAGHAASGGVFCQSTMSFIIRPEASGALTFKVMGSTQQGNIIDVGGTALPHAGGWRYQVKSASTPADRCTVDIRKSGGGYSLKTVGGARCESLGGIGAAALIESAAFPAASRVAGAVPPSGTPDNFPAFDCAHKRFFSFNEPATVRGAQSPAEIVRSLVAQDTGEWGKISGNEPTATMRK